MVAAIDPKTERAQQRLLEGRSPSRAEADKGRAISGSPQSRTEARQTRE